MNNRPGALARSLLQNYSVLVLLIALGVYLSIATDSFATISNIQNVLQQVSVVGILAMGMTLLLISANFDLSIGGMIALIGVVIARCANSLGIGVAVIAALVIGLLLGLLNGLIVTKVRVNSLIATLGTGMAFGGVAYLLSGSSPIVLTDESLQAAMSTTVAVIPVPVYLLVLVIAVSAWFLHYTVGGRQLYAVGANENAARYAGIIVDRVRLVPFVITGLYCGIGALILTGLLNSAQPSVGASYPLQVIAAAVVGGVSISGGRGSIPRAVVGVLLIGVVSNGFNLLGLDPNYQNIFTGVIVIVAVAFDALLRRQFLRRPAHREPVRHKDNTPRPDPSAPNRTDNATTDGGSPARLR